MAINGTAFVKLLQNGFKNKFQYYVYYTINGQRPSTSENKRCKIHVQIRTVGDKNTGRWKVSEMKGPKEPKKHGKAARLK